jgi:hypothetical protein
MRFSFILVLCVFFYTTTKSQNLVKISPLGERLADTIPYTRIVGGEFKKNDCKKNSSQKKTPVQIKDSESIIVTEEKEKLNEK